MTTNHIHREPHLPYIIFDIDGTLANIKQRLHYIQEIKEDVRNENGSWKGEKVVKKPDWNAFNRAMVHDEPNLHIIGIYKAMCDMKRGGDYPAVFVTGRPEDYRAETEEWLRNNGMQPTRLFMRPEGDYRSDVEIKREIHEKYIKGAPVFFVVDDRDAVVAMWRELGYKCLQCQKGDY
jgi:hypothetical protein